MQLTQWRKAVEAPGWIAELKFEGYRLLAEVEGRRVALRTRDGADATGCYPELVASLAGLSKTRIVLDGEVCVHDDKGRCDLARLHARSQPRGWYEGADPVVFVAFDVLVFRDFDMREEPLFERKKKLAALLARKLPHVLLAQFLPGEAGPRLFNVAEQMGLEGIVMKRLHSTYQEDEPPSGDWVKVKRP